MPPNLEAELKAATDRVLASRSQRKLVVAGAGAGKTFLFQKLLEASEGEPKQRLVLTFINNLKDDLDRSLGDLSQVFTLHGYCQHLLRTHAILRNGLTANFRCYPTLTSIIKIDWEWLKGSRAPRFVDLMRNLSCEGEHASFYRERSNFYDAVDFDDSVHRTQEQLAANKGVVPAYTLVLIDEFQDFNKMEASVIDLLADHNSIVIAGDDDQALYSELRGASWEHIRAHYLSGHYEIFELPFCMRCPEVIVAAVQDVIAKAREIKKLDGRIEKPYRYYEPVKGDDSRRYPCIELVETTVQRANANYFGRYIEDCIRAIPDDDVQFAAEKNEPVALIIGSNPYRRQVEEHLSQAGLLTSCPKAVPNPREDALKILNEDTKSNLGWRLILSCGDQRIARELVRKAEDNALPLVDVIGAKEREKILAEVQAWMGKGNAEHREDQKTAQSIAVTSYEGSKGRSAQYVFLVGVHSGDLPRNAANILDIEICRFVVGLTRTKKQCTILVAKNAMGQFKQPSEFLGWIKAERCQKKKIDAAHWR
jgi:superfamily I DNA/RNA helicase